MFTCGPSLSFLNPTPVPSPNRPSGPPVSPVNNQIVVNGPAAASYGYCQGEQYCINNNQQHYANANSMPQMYMGPECCMQPTVQQTGEYTMVPSAHYVQQQYASPDRSVFSANQSANATVDGSVPVSRVGSTMDMASLEQQPLQMMALDTSTGSLVPVSNQSMRQPCVQPMNSVQTLYGAQPQYMALDTSTGSYIALPGGGMGQYMTVSQPAAMMPAQAMSQPYPTYPVNVVYTTAAPMAPPVSMPMPFMDPSSAMHQPQTYIMNGAQQAPAMVVPVPSILERKRSVCVKLHQFNLSRWRPASVRNIVGDIACFVTDAHGSKYVQEQLRLGNRGIVNLVLDEVMQFFQQISCDQYGNFVVQKLVEVCDRKDRMTIAEHMCRDMVGYSHDRYACRVVQKILKASDAHLDYNIKLKMYDGLSSHVVMCSSDQSANHVVQCFMEVLRVDDMHHIIHQFAYHIVHMAGTKYGCRVLQKALRDLADPLKGKLIDAVRVNLVTLMMDEFGNYVVQEAIRTGTLCQKRAMLEEGICGRVMEFGMDKHASNVLERFIEACDTQSINAMAQEVINWKHERGNGTCGVGALLCDQYGNYVVQKLISSADAHYRDTLLTLATQYKQQLEHYTFGKQIIARLDGWTAPAERKPRPSISSQQG